MKYLFFPLLLLAFNCYSQCKSFRLTSKGDTINCTDVKDLRQGKWVNKVASLRGEPGFEEEGVYKDGKKEGVWRLYTSMGDLFAVERYRWGNKDGLSQYFSIMGLVREESWKAVNPQNPYDTIEVPDLHDPYKVAMKVVKIDGSTVKHGNWKYYEGGTGMLTKTESYFLDALQDPMKKAMADALGRNASDTTVGKPKLAAKPKPKEVMEFEKKVGKKKVKVIDGSTNY